MNRSFIGSTAKGPTVNRYDPRNGSVQTWKLPFDVGSMALREKGGAIVALRDGIFAFDFDTGRADLMVRWKRKIRAPGSMTAKSIVEAASSSAEWTNKRPAAWPDLSVRSRSHANVKLDDGIVCFNMPCWSPDDKVFYFAETWEYILLMTMTSRPAQFPISASIVDLRDHPGGTDGSAVDEEGYIWNAQVISGKLVRYAPDGRVDRSFDFPVKNLTSVIFGRA